MLSLPMLLALATDAGAAAAQPQLNPLQRLIGSNSILPPLVLMFGVFYFLIIRPQQKKQQEHEAWQKKVGQGDEVVTTGGLVGKVTHVGTDDILTVEVGDKVRVRVLRSHVTGVAPGAKAAAAAVKDKASA